MIALTRKLISWYTKNKIEYPWRQSTDPYKVWLSEILLQQTRIPVVLNYYDRILRRYPDLRSLAAASDSDFLALWSGLGYYRRAENMLKCARLLSANHGGRFPVDFQMLTTLPGIGQYTAGALRNICFNKLTPAIDGNIRRVLSRLTASEDELNDAFLRLGNGTLPADFFQALMELGENICLPNPVCGECPVKNNCEAYDRGVQMKLPMRRKQKDIQIFHWYLLLLQSKDSHYYAQNRERPFLKSAWIFPDLLTAEALSTEQQKRKFYTQWGIRISGVREAAVVQHAVTYRKIFVHVLMPRTYHLNGSAGKWLNDTDFKEHATSSIRDKVLRSLKVQNREPKPA